MNEIQTIQNKIYEIRDQRVMLDFATSNNPGSQEVTNWKSQIATSNFIMQNNVNVVKKVPCWRSANRVLCFIVLSGVGPLASL